MGFVITEIIEQNKSTNKLIVHRSCFIVLVLTSTFTCIVPDITSSAARFLWDREISDPYTGGGIALWLAGESLGEAFHCRMLYVHMVANRHVVSALIIHKQTAVETPI
jgi:hypothetical protein